MVGHVAGLVGTVEDDSTITKATRYSLVLNTLLRFSINSISVRITIPHTSLRDSNPYLGEKSGKEFGEERQHTGHIWNLGGGVEIV